MGDADRYPDGLWSSIFQKRHVLYALCIGGLCLGGISSAAAQETTSYTYDARGRLTKVQRSGGPESGAVASYTYDTADNRASVNVTGAAGSGSGDSDGGASAPAFKYVVVPLNGYTIIRIAH